MIHVQLKPEGVTALYPEENVVYPWFSLNLLLLFLPQRICSLFAVTAYIFEGSSWIVFSVFSFLEKVVTLGYVFYTSLHSYYLSGLSPFGSHLSWSAVTKTRHHTFAAALPALSRAEVPVRQGRVAHKVLQSVSAASSVNRPLQQSRLTEMQESPCHVLSFAPTLSNAPTTIEKSIPYSLISNCGLFTALWSQGFSDYLRLTHCCLLWKVETHQLCHSQVSNCASLSLWCLWFLESNTHLVHWYM